MAVVSLLAQVADLKASQVAGAASSVMPSGVILPYGGATAPTGWLICDGQAISQADYASLFAALGTTYNTQLNPTTGVNWVAPSAGQFRVPDMRGMFLRGEGTPNGLDAVSVGANQVDKTKKNGLSASAGSSSVSVAGAKNQMNNGTGTGSAAGLIRAVAQVGTSAANNHVCGYGSGAYADYNNTTSYPGSDHTHSFSYGGDFGASGTAAAQAITIATGDNETRPINRGVKYIIKV